MNQIEIDIRDWKIRTHLPDALWQRFASGRLRAREADALQSHLLVCPCCQEQLIEVQAAMRSYSLAPVAA